MNTEETKQMRRTQILFILRIGIIILLNICVIGFVRYDIQINRPSIQTLSKVGSRGDEVRQIQQKLKNTGLYTGAVDGIYGNGTQNAVKQFQKQNGLTPDGIAGPQTLKAMGIGNTQNSGSHSNSDMQLLARIISAESRGESYEGQVAVGAVVLNRVEHPSFPDSIAGVVYQPGAFSAINDGQINQEVYESSKRAAREALNGSDPSGGAIYYYNPDKTSNQWIRSRPVITRIGNHLFCS